MKPKTKARSSQAKKKPSATGPETQFAEKSFWDTVKTYARAIGEAPLVMAFTLHNAFKDTKTPVWAKTVIGGALAYLILPLDAIPDALPVVGFSDDFGALTAATLAVAAQITKKHKDDAAKQVNEFFA